MPDRRSVDPPQPLHGDRSTEVSLDSPGIDEVQVVPWPLMLRRRAHTRVAASERYPWVVLAAALCGLFTVSFSITVLTIAVDGIAREFGSTRSVLIWVITGPILLGAIVMPAAGKLSDLYGARRIFLASMFGSAVFALLAAVAWDPASLIVFRVLGAAIGAASGPASVGLINRLFPATRRAQALGYWALVTAGAPVLGVVIGGPIVESSSWRWVFVAQAPMALAAFAVCAVVFPRTPGSEGERFDLVGAVLLALSVSSLVVALNRAPEEGWGWTSPWVVGGFLLCPVLLVAFVLWERRSPAQLVPLRYFGRRNVAWPFVNLFFINFAYMGGFFLTPFLLADVLGYSESKIGYLSIARPLTFSIVGPLAGYVATRMGERFNAVVGATVMMGSMALFMSVGGLDSGAEVVVVLALMASGAGLGATAPAMATAIANSVEDRDLGVASGAEQMLGQIGVVVGTQIMITVQQAGGGTASAYAHGYLVGLGAAALALVAASFVRPTIGRRGVLEVRSELLMDTA